MRKQVLFLKGFIPYSWWIAMLTSVGYVRLRLGRFEGIRHSWIWDNEDGILSHKVCQRLLEKEFFRFFESATRGAPQLHGIDRLFTLITIHSPELELISKKEFFFKLEQLDEVKQRVFDFLLTQTPMNIRRGTFIGFKVSSLTELTLLDFALERPWSIRPISKLL